MKDRHAPFSRRRDGLSRRSPLPKRPSRPSPSSRSRKNTVFPQTTSRIHRRNRQILGRIFCLLAPDGLSTAKGGSTPFFRFSLTLSLWMGAIRRTAAFPTGFPFLACSQKAWNERIVIFANLSKNQLKIRIEFGFLSLII